MRITYMNRATPRAIGLQPTKKTARGAAWRLKKGMERPQWMVSRCRAGIPDQPWRWAILRNGVSLPREGGGRVEPDI
jgi:hypothetical protein